MMMSCFYMTLGDGITSIKWPIEPCPYLIKARANMQAKIDDLAQKNSIESARKKVHDLLKRQRILPV